MRWPGDYGRPYMNKGSRTIIKEIMKAGKLVKDTFLNDGLKWNVEGKFNGRKGVWELVIDRESNTVVHYLFKSREK